MQVRRIRISELDIRSLASKIPPRAPENQVKDFSNLIVNKPWGNEYLMYRNDFVEVWSLFIRGGGSTSLHCHPNKKTGMLLVEGEALFSGLAGEILMRPLDALVVDAGAFKKTKALSSSGVRLLEFETPPAKHDLMRLSDEYGREDKPYEGSDQVSLDTGICIRFPEGDEAYASEKSISNCCFSIKKIVSEKLRPEDVDYLLSNDLIVVLEGLIYWPGNDEIYGVAEVVNIKDIMENREAVRIFNLTVMGVKYQEVVPKKSFQGFLSKIIQK